MKENMENMDVLTNLVTTALGEIKTEEIEAEKYGRVVGTEDPATKEKRSGFDKRMATKNWLIKKFYELANHDNFWIEGRIVMVDKKTGKRYE